MPLFCQYYTSLFTDLCFELNWRNIANFQKFICWDSWEWLYKFRLKCTYYKFWGPGTNKPVQCSPKNLLEVALIQKVIWFPSSPIIIGLSWDATSLWNFLWGAKPEYYKRGWMHLIYDFFGIDTFQLILIKKIPNDTAN